MRPFKPAQYETSLEEENSEKPDENESNPEPSSDEVKRLDTGRKAVVGSDLKIFLFNYFLYLLKILILQNIKFLFQSVYRSGKYF